MIFYTFYSMHALLLKDENINIQNLHTVNSALLYYKAVYLNKLELICKNPQRNMA